MPQVPEPLPPQFPVFVGNAKLNLFTPSEQLAVVTVTMTDPVVKLMYDRLLGAAFLTYEDPEVEQGLQLLVSKELLTPERKAEIVSAMGWHERKRIQSGGNQDRSADTGRGSSRSDVGAMAHDCNLALYRSPALLSCA